MKTNFARWMSPILGQEVENIYRNTYGENGKCFIDILETSPYEIAVISRLITYLQSKKGSGK